MSLPREEEPRLFGLLENPEALALVGPRRAGKSTLARRLLDAWRERGGKGELIDLEDPRLERTQAGRFALVPKEILLKQVEQVPPGGLVVIDEAQNGEDWVRIVRWQVEHKLRHALVTGSNAQLLSSEIATALGGRALAEKILPTSYRDARRWGLRRLEDYLEVGGFPECVLNPADAPKLHREYLSAMVTRDAANRLRLRKPSELERLALLLLSEPGKTLSSAKTANALSISQPTYRKYLSALEAAFVVMPVPPFLPSPRERLIADAKHYAYDTGLARSVGLSTQVDAGRRLENLVAIELLRRDYRLSYLLTQKGECDFIAERLGSPRLAVQVYAGEEEPPEREEKGLRAGMTASSGEGLFLTSGGRLPQSRLPTGARQLSIEQWLLESPRD